MSDQTPVVPNPADLNPSTKRFSISALVSTITGALSYLLILCHSWIDMSFILAAILAPISAIAAIIFGQKGKREIRKSDEMITGKKLANAGLTMGYVYLGICILIVVLLIMGVAGLASYFTNL